MNNPTILLRSSWQTVNIGDIAHTPGLLSILRQMMPGAHVILWPRSVSDGVREMLLAHFPGLEIVDGQVDAAGRPDSEQLRAAWERADFFLHGSGPAPLCALDAAAWASCTGRPYGFYGITAENPEPARAAALERAAFVLTRETASLDHLRRAGVTSPFMDFCPDATFACDLRDDAAADAWCRAEGLVPGSFVCAIPRLRYTPYYKIRRCEPSAEDLRREAVNSAHARTDHDKLCQAITHVVREHGLRVLICPEMTYQLDIMDELLVDPLPADVRSQVVVRRRYWFTDEAASVYARARAVVSFECHSPILALRQGVPVIYLRQPTDTIKGQMWRDVGLSDWILEIDDITPGDITRVLDSQLRHPGAARGHGAQALERINVLYQKGVRQISRALRGDLASL